MNIAKFNPWNWFNKEEHQGAGLLPKDMRSGFAALDKLHSEIDQIFDGIFEHGLPMFPRPRAGSPEESAELKPKLDIAGGDEHYLVTVELPGVDEKDVHLELRGDCLIIKGEKKNEHEEKGKDYYRMERSYGSFQRVLSLPEDVDSSGIKAAHKAGVLTVTLPRKAAALPAGRSIAIEKG